MTHNFKKWIAGAAATVLVLQLPIAPHSAVGAESDQTQAMLNFYDNWKERYLVQEPYVTEETQYYVQSSKETYSGGNQSVAVSVSEAHGYGMLITACMAPYDPEAQAYFDGMVRFYDAHRSDIGPHLMSWQQCDTGTALIDGAEEGSMQPGFADSATDGDLDIAYALLLADEAWGSDGEIAYRDAALAILDDIMTYEVNQETWTLSLGDWAYGMTPDETYYGATRASDFIMSYFPVFAEVTGDARWKTLYDNTYSIINHIVDTYQTGLLPDFLVPGEDGNYVPAPEHFLEDVTDGQYGYNSCRTPWRIGMDYLLNGNEDAKHFADTLNAFILQSTNSDPGNIVAGYTLDGTPTADYDDLCFIAPFLIAAKCGDNTEWTEALRELILKYGDDVYFGDTIKMLCLIADAGAFPVPGKQTTQLRGDINLDGSVNGADAALLQSYLLGNETLSKEQAVLADVNGDMNCDGMDLAAMRLYISYDLSWEECIG